jgi:hypothetical protein
VTRHESDAGTPGSRNDGAALLDRRGNGLFDQDMDPLTDAFKRNVVMQMGRRGDRDRIHTEAEQRVDITDRFATDGTGNKIPLLAIRIGNSHQLNAGHIGEHPRMV